jgi:ArsR family transcriptional regulator, arsenate/arsenite/antimonite-responsive transcriptional repressor
MSADEYPRDVDEFAELAEVAAALSDPLRLRILDLLAGGRAGACCSPANPEAPVAMCACDVAPKLGGLAPSKLAYHLGRLKAAGLIHEQRRGKWVYYSIDLERLSKCAQALASRWSGTCSLTRRPACRRPASRSRAGARS